MELGECTLLGLAAAARGAQLAGQPHRRGCVFRDHMKYPRLTYHFALSSVYSVVESTQAQGHRHVHRARALMNPTLGTQRD